MVEAGRTWAGGGRAKKDDRVLNRLVGCLGVRAVEKYDRLRWQTAGGEAGGQMPVAEVDGRAAGLEEEVFDGITSVIDDEKEISRQKGETWNSRRLGVSLARQMTTARRYRVFPEGGSLRAHVAQGSLVG
jgi:hypothetical protein